MATILAVDDATAIRTMVAEVLGAEGHEVIQAKDGGEALLYARRKGADLVLADINMPGMTGMGLVSKLRQLNHYQNTPILMLTIENKRESKNQARELGATGWITKPITESRLLFAVNSVLGKCA